MLPCAINACACWCVLQADVIKKQKGNSNIPNLVTQCVAYLDDRGKFRGRFTCLCIIIIVVILGLLAEGIFRLSGNKVLIEDLKAVYDRYEKWCTFRSFLF